MEAATSEKTFSVLQQSFSRLLEAVFPFLLKNRWCTKQEMETAVSNNFCCKYLSAVSAPQKKKQKKLFVPSSGIFTRQVKTWLIKTSTTTTTSLFKYVDCNTQVSRGNLFSFQFQLFSEGFQHATSTSSTFSAMCNVAFTATFGPN